MGCARGARGSHQEKARTWARGPPAFRPLVANLRLPRDARWTKSFGEIRPRASLPLCALSAPAVPSRPPGCAPPYPTLSAMYPQAVHTHPQPPRWCTAPLPSASPSGKRAQSPARGPDSHLYCSPGLACRPPSGLSALPCRGGSQTPDASLHALQPAGLPQQPPPARSTGYSLPEPRPPPRAVSLGAGPALPEPKSRSGQSPRSWKSCSSDLCRSCALSGSLRPVRSP